MKSGRLLTSSAFSLLLTLSVAQADDDITMSVIEEGDTPDRVLAPIELPDVAASEGVSNSEQGRRTSDAAREKGREFGEERAAEGRERSEQARETAEEAAENGRERIKDDIGRDVLDDLPDDVRDNIPDDVRDRGRGDNGPPSGRGG